MFFIGAPAIGNNTARDTRQQEQAAANSLKAQNPMYVSGPTSQLTEAGWTDSASEVAADITRKQWQDWQQRFQPYDKRLADLAMGKEDNQQAEARAGSAVDSAFKTAQGTYSRNRARYGLSDTAGMSDRMALSNTAAKVGAVNQTRLATQDRDMAMMTGGLSQARG